MMDESLEDAERVLERAARAGLDPRRITAELERDGVGSFCDSYRELLACVASKLRAVPSV
jgi:hypothetical protein